MDLIHWINDPYLSILITSLFSLDNNIIDVKSRLAQMPEDVLCFVIGQDQTFLFAGFWPEVDICSNNPEEERGRRGFGT